MLLARTMLYCNQATRIYLPMLSYILYKEYLCNAMQNMNLSNKNYSILGYICVYLSILFYSKRVLVQRQRQRQRKYMYMRCVFPSNVPSRKQKTKNKNFSKTFPTPSLL